MILPSLMALSRSLRGSLCGPLHFSFDEFEPAFVMQFPSDSICFGEATLLGGEVEDTI